MSNNVECFPSKWDWIGTMVCALVVLGLCAFVWWIEPRIGKAFNDGAKWADRTMLDKVCEWLKENVEYAVMKKNGKHTIELAGIELAEDLQKDMRI